MRNVIALAAFAVPVLVMVAIGATCAEVPEVRPALDATTLAELRRFVPEHLDLLNHYAPRPGGRDVADIPHLALERFDRRGCDAQGHPWYRLAGTPVPCGIVRRDRPGRPLRLADGATPTLVMPLAGGWHYWEVAPLAVERPGPAKNP